MEELDHFRTRSTVNGLFKRVLSLQKRFKPSKKIQKMSNQIQPETLQTLLAGFQNFSSLLQQALTPNKSQLNHATETSGTANTADIQGVNTATHRMPSIETPIMVNLFEREANEEDKIYAQKHGFQKLREKLVASGEKMSIQEDMEDSDSMSDENGQPTQCTETVGNEDEQSEEEQPRNDIQSEQVQPHVQQEMELPHDGLTHHSPIQTVHIGDPAMEEHEETRHGGKRIKLRRLQDIRNIETPKSTKRNINKNKKKKVVSPEYQRVREGSVSQYRRRI